MNAVTPLTEEQKAQQEQKAAHEGLLARTLVSLDIFLNVLTGGLEDETISSRMARWSTNTGLRKLIGTAICRFLDLFESDHGAKAEAGDLERAQTVEQTESTSGNLL